MSEPERDLDFKLQGILEAVKRQDMLANEGRMAIKALLLEELPKLDVKIGDTQNDVDTINHNNGYMNGWNSYEYEITRQWRLRDET